VAAQHPAELAGPRGAASPYFLIWLLAALLRGVHLWELRDTPVFSMLLGDARSYDTWAREIAAGHWLGAGVFYQTPLYPYFLGILYALTGRDLLVVRLVQLVLGATSCVLLARAGEAFFGRRVGIVAGLLLAIYPTAIFFDGLIQKPVLDLFFFTLLLFLLGRLSEAPRPWRWLPVGLALGFLMLTRENALVLVACVAVWLVAHVRQAGWRRQASAAALLVAGLAAVLLPVALRNQRIGGEFHLTTTQFGATFYVGNNPKADGTYAPLRWGRGSAAYERVDATELAEAALGRTLTPGQVSAYWAGQALAYIRSQPGHWLRLMLRKWLLVWNVVELGDTVDEYTYAEWSYLLKGLEHVLHFGILAPLAAFGVCLTWRDWRRLWLLYLMLASYAASVALFIVFSRYRFLLVPLLLLFGSAGLLGGWNLLAQRRAPPRLWVAAGAALAAALIVNWTLVPKDGVRAITHTNIGIFLAKEERKPEDAVVHFQKALTLNPRFVEAHGNLGAVLVMQGRADEALAHLTEALRLKPDYVEAHYNIGVVLGQRGRDDEAIAHFGEVLRLRPTHADAHSNLGIALARQGRLPEATPHFREAARLRPDWPEGRYNLGLALFLGGEFADAASEFAHVLRLQPENPLAHQKLGESLVRLGRCQEATAQFEEALRLRPGWPEPVDQLGRTSVACAPGG
jgi:tetratricopeptide (TPR) repeat protein